MAKDFRASQVETTKIILSGAIPARHNLGGIIYSGSKATDRQGGIPTAMLANVGRDVQLFVSGNIGGANKVAGSVTLFGGDVVVSGTMYMEQMVTEVTTVTHSDHHVSGSLLIRNNSSTEPDIKVGLPQQRGSGTTLDASIALVQGGAGDANGEGAIVFDYRSGSNKADAVIWEGGGTLNISASEGMHFYVGSGSVAEDAASDLDNGQAGTFAFYSHSGSKGPLRNRFIIFSGSQNLPAVPPEFGLDTNFYVSGNIGGKDTTNTSIGVFGGDLHVSGNLSVGGTGVGGEWTETSTNLHPADSSGAQNVLIGGTAFGNSDIIFKKQGGAEFNAQGGSTVDSDFLVWKDPTTGPNKKSLIAAHPIKTGLNRPTVVILSGGFVGHPDEGNYADMSFYVSGACGRRNSSLGGVSVFGGDTVISGSLAVLETCGTGGSISGSIHTTAGGIQYLKAGTGIAIASASNGQITITATGGGGGSSEWTDAGGGTGPLYPAGSSGAQDVIIGNTSINDADILLGYEGIAEFNKQKLDSDFRVFPQAGGTNPNTTAIHVDASQKRVLILSGGFTGDPDDSTNSDVSFFISGSKNKTNKNNRGQTLFGGSIAVSGSHTTRFGRYANIREVTYGNNMNPSQNWAALSPHTCQINNADHYVIINGIDYTPQDLKTGGAEAGSLVQVNLPDASHFGEGRVLYIKMTFAGVREDGIFVRAGLRLYPAAGDSIDSIPNPLSYGMTFKQETHQLISNGVDKWYVFGSPVLGI